MGRHPAGGSDLSAVKYVGIGLFFVFGAISGYWCVVVLTRGEYLTALTMFAFAACWFAMLGAGIRTSRGRVCARSEFDKLGTVVRPDWAIDLLTRLSLTAILVATTTYAVLGPLGHLDIPIPRVQRFALPGVAAVTAVIAAVMLWRAVRRGSLTYLRLSPKGFEFGGGLSTARGDWSSVTGVTDSQPGARNLTPSAIVVRLSDGRYRTMASTASCTRNKDELRDMVTFYWREPKAREELTDGRALTRLSANGFSTSSE